MKKLLKAKDLSNLLNISKSTVYDWVEKDYLPYILLKRGENKAIIRFDENEIENWLSQRKRETRKHSLKGRSRNLERKGGDKDEYR